MPKIVTLFSCFFLIPIVILGACQKRQGISTPLPGVTRPDAEDWVESGITLAKKGQYDGAIKDFTKALELEPDNYLARYNRGLAWAMKGDPDQAIVDYSAALQTEPRYYLCYAAYYKRGLAWQEKGHYDRAIEDFTKALELNPYSAEAYNQLAWILSTFPDKKYRNGIKAVEWARRATELDPKPAFLDTLAAALAETGRFGEAVETQERAVALLQLGGEKEERAAYMERLKAYRACQAWRSYSREGTGYPVKIGDKGGPPGAPHVQQARREEPSEARKEEGPGPRNRLKIFCVQVGAFLLEQNAEECSNLLKKRGYAPYVFVTSDSRGSRWHTVRIGAYPQEEEARAAAAAFRSKEKMPAVVRPGGRL